MTISTKKQAELARKFWNQFQDNKRRPYLCFFELTEGLNAMFYSCHPKKNLARVISYIRVYNSHTSY